MVVAGGECKIPLFVTGAASPSSETESTSCADACTRRHHRRNQDELKVTVQDLRTDYSRELHNSRASGFVRTSPHPLLVVRGIFAKIGYAARIPANKRHMHLIRFRECLPESVNASRITLRRHSLGHETSLKDFCSVESAGVVFAHLPRLAFATVLFPAAKAVLP